MRTLAASVALVLAGSLAGCGDPTSAIDPAQVDSVAPPSTGQCRVLHPADILRPDNATRTVACTEPHTAETYAVVEVPRKFRELGYDSAELAQFGYERCSKQFAKHLGADASLVLRTMLAWVWFRPSEKAWDEGARWFRCDLVGGEHARGGTEGRLLQLPKWTKSLFRPTKENQGVVDDRWLVCADGNKVATSRRVACSQEHTWRAVTTITVGQPEDAWPGERLVHVRTRAYCRESVSAWMSYPKTFRFSYTLIHEDQWQAGNRRAVCWARTDK